MLRQKAMYEMNFGTSKLLAKTIDLEFDLQGHGVPLDARLTTREGPTH